MSVTEHQQNWQRQQQLTFYEDLYLKANNGQRRGFHQASSTSPILTRPGWKSPHNEQERSLDKQYPESRPQVTTNFVYDLSSLPRSLATGGGSESRYNKQYKELLDNNNHHDDTPTKFGQLLAAKETDLKPSSSEKHSNLYNDSQAKDVKPFDGHIYNAPTQETREASLNYVKTLRNTVDENNYCIPLSTQIDIVNARQRWTESHKVSSKPSTNLRSMRRIARSMDSIRAVQANRQRNSTIVSPSIWINEANGSNDTQLSSAVSCSNIDEPDFMGFGKLSHKFTSLDKENYLPGNGHESTEQIKWRTWEMERSSRSGFSTNRSRKSDGDISQRHSENSLHIANLRSGLRKMNYSSYSKRTAQSRFYENIDFAEAVTKGDSSNYVNLKDCTQPVISRELDYADLDFSLLDQKSKETKNVNAFSHRTTTLARCQQSREDSDDNVDYTVINIKATEAARKACQEHQKYRQRRLSSMSPNSQ